MLLTETSFPEKDCMTKEKGSGNERIKLDKVSKLCFRTTWASVCLLFLLCNNDTIISQSSAGQLPLITTNYSFTDSRHSHTLLQLSQVKHWLSVGVLALAVCGLLNLDDSHGVLYVCIVSMTNIYIIYALHCLGYLTPFTKYRPQLSLKLHTTQT